MESPRSSPQMMFLCIPDDKEFLAAVGVIALRHAHWDYTMRMTIKSLRGTGMKEALEPTSTTHSGLLRNEVSKLAWSKLGAANPAVKQLDTLLDRGKDATRERNDLMHNICVRLEGSEQTLMHDRKTLTRADLPTIAALEALADKLASITEELNTARLSGFLYAALNGPPSGHGPG